MAFFLLLLRIMPVIHVAEDIVLNFFVFFFLLQEVSYLKNRVLLLQRAKDALV